MAMSWANYLDLMKEKKKGMNLGWSLENWKDWNLDYLMVFLRKERRMENC